MSLQINCMERITVTKKDIRKDRNRVIFFKLIKSVQKILVMAFNQRSKLDLLK